jgi:hypothetical protein
MIKLGDFKPKAVRAQVDRCQIGSVFHMVISKFLGATNTIKVALSRDRAGPNPELISKV